MKPNLDLLEPDFREKISKVLSNCQSRGFEVRPFFTLRDVRTQAKLWRQSRPLIEVDRAIRKLRNEGAPFLSRLLENVGPQHGRWATNNLPGQSWHQWGEAVDCFVVIENSKAVWTSKHPGFLAFAEEAKALGLTAGYYWTRQDAVHVQSHNEGVRAKYTWAEIDKEMLNRFSE